MPVCRFSRVLHPAFASVALLALPAIWLPASAASIHEHPIIGAVQAGRCEEAVKFVNEDVAKGDAQAALLGGRMLDEGICVQASSELAAKFFERAARLGDRTGALEEAAMVGQGKGAAQDYARAGEICRAAGLDPQGRLSAPALGYACTLGRMAGRSMRQLLPTRAFLGSGDPIVLDVSPPNRDVTIVSAPSVAREAESATGSNLRRPVINLQQSVDEAWRAAIAAAPPPADPGAKQADVQIPIDVDMTLEAASPSVAVRQTREGVGLNQLPAAQMLIVPPGAGHLKGG